ncbi:MAG TPA: hypothetical protein VHX60_01825 [Acidobacteriaceae bacterium]|nr:hypothetical protein [Acidobacteriaceae bacterium]
MTVRIMVRVDGVSAKTFTYTSPGNLPIPDIGETVANPNLDGTALQVERRHFEYGQDSVRVTLDCTPSQVHA